MKSIKKLFALVLAIAMALAMCTVTLATGTTPDPSFHAGDPNKEPKTGSVTIRNATVGQDYRIFKIFDLTYDYKEEPMTDDDGNVLLDDDDNPIITQTVPTYDEEGNVTSPVAYSYTKAGTDDPLYDALVGSTSPFTLAESSEAGKYNVTLKSNKTAEDITAFLKGLVTYTTDANGKITGVSADSVLQPIDEKTATTDEVKFPATTDTYTLPYGYYFISSTLGAEVTIDSTIKDVVIVDKNPEPEFPPDPFGPVPNPNDPANPVKNPGKVIVEKDEDGEVIGHTLENTANFGDVVDFNISLKASSYADAVAEHTHIDNCYKPTAAAQAAAPAGQHTHTDDCYVKKVLCGIPEHTHTRACDTDSDGDYDECTLAEHTHSSSCLKVDPTHPDEDLKCGYNYEYTYNLDLEDPGCEVELDCGKTEHTHDADCYNAYGELICPKEEHTHMGPAALTTGDGPCYDVDGNLVCTRHGADGSKTDEEQNYTELVTYYYITDTLGKGFDLIFDDDNVATNNSAELNAQLADHPFRVYIDNPDGGTKGVYDDTDKLLERGKDYTLRVSTPLVDATSGEKQPTHVLITIPFGEKYGSVATICVDYSAVMNNQAVLAGSGNPNTMNFSYVTDPNFDPDDDPENPKDPSNPPYDPADPTPDDPADNPDYPKDPSDPTPDDPDDEPTYDPDDSSNPPFDPDDEKNTLTYVYALGLLKANSPEKQEDGTLREEGSMVALEAAEFSLMLCTVNADYADKEDEIPTTFTESNPITKYYDLTPVYAKPYIIDGDNDLSTDDDDVIQLGIYELCESTDPAAVTSFKVATTADVNEDDSTKPYASLPTGGKGVLVIKGLEEGMYQVTEEVAPLGYNKLGDPFYMTSSNKDAKKYTTEIAESVKIGDATVKNITVTVDDNVFSSVVENSNGAELPATGGIGTRIFYAAGSVLLVGAAILLITRRRMKVED